jgi:hypothetical protein
VRAGEGKHLRMHLGSVALGSVVLLIGSALMAESAFASGDANETDCPATTESSPGFRAWLPDCRAFEIVSEANSDDAANVVGSYGFPDGAHVYYKSSLPTPDLPVGNGLPEQFLATRTSSGWVQHMISPPQGEGPSQLEFGAQGNAEGVSFTSDFSNAFVNSPFRSPLEEPTLNQTTGMGVYRLAVGSGSVSMLSLPDLGVLTQTMLEGSNVYRGFAEVNDWGSFLAGSSSDGSKAFFVTTAKLTTAIGTPEDTHAGGNEIYERAEGHTYLAGILPDGSVPICGAEISQGVGSTVGTEPFYSYEAISHSGTNVVFSVPGREAGLAGVPCNETATGLFLRNVVRGTTVQLPGTLFGGRAGVGPSEEEVIFTLGAGIHEYHVSTGQTVEIGSGALLAYSRDGSRVYFLGGEEGIYVYNNGTAKLVPGTQGGNYSAGFRGGGLILAGKNTAYGATHNMPVASAGESGGSHLLFIDGARLTEYKTEGHFEAYIYDAGTETVTCISCNPRNEPPIGNVGEPGEGRAKLIDEFSLDNGEEHFQAPSPPFISDDGSRAVFETNEALLPQDVNGTSDVYEWARSGTNGCSRAHGSYSTVVDGCLYMLSSGLGQEVFNLNGITSGTHLVGASEELKDVYLETSESLLPGLDNASKLYDVRIDGGFPHTAPSIGCEADQCGAGGGRPARLGEPKTEAFVGPGDVKHVAAPAGKRASSERKRRLGRALKSCRRHKQRRRRVGCERETRRRLGAQASRGVARGSRKGAV